MVRVAVAAVRGHDLGARALGASCSLAVTSKMPDINYLPPELSSRIIQDVVSDHPYKHYSRYLTRRTESTRLLTLAVVAPSFLELVQPLLYRDVKLEEEGQGQAFARTLRQPSGQVNVSFMESLELEDGRSKAWAPWMTRLNTAKLCEH